MNTYRVTLSGGEMFDIKAGAVETGTAGELIFHHFHWTLMHTHYRPFKWIAAGEWTEVTEIARREVGQ